MHTNAFHRYTQIALEEQKTKTKNSEAMTRAAQLTAKQMTRAAPMTAQRNDARSANDSEANDARSANDSEAPMTAKTMTRKQIKSTDSHKCFSQMHSDKSYPHKKGKYLQITLLKNSNCLQLINL